MSLFSGRGKDGVKEFEEMRRALGSTEAPKENDPTSQGTVGTPAQASRSTADQPGPGAAPADQAAKPTATPPEQCSSVVSAGSTWQGTLKLDGSVRVEGHLSGEIEARDTVHVAESAHVDAKVNASFVVIAGQFQGQVQCSERLELMPSSRITGELTTKSLVIHEGAFIDGQIHMITDKSVAGSSKTAQATVTSGPQSAESKKENQPKQPGGFSARTSDPASTAQSPAPGEPVVPADSV